MTPYYCADDYSADTDVVVVDEFLNNDTLCLQCTLMFGCVVLIHSTSNPQHLGVHTTNSSQDGIKTCVNASTCSGSNCTVAVYEQSIDGVIDQPEPVFTTAFTFTPGVQGHHKDEYKFRLQKCLYCYRVWHDTTGSESGISDWDELERALANCIA